ncbi:hypothetical protein [Stappia sp.]|jgi:hypothetical protein|uniref:hypothetical protein n=1 Tax=Stappia sp. TaxID=1870903 RepID=UPI003A99FF1B
MGAARRSLLDAPAARLGALALAVASLAAIVWIGRVGFAGVALTPFENIAPATAQSVAANNPQLAACLDERIGAVDTMKEEGVIDATRYALFRDRAVSYCQTQFPSER